MGVLDFHQVHSIALLGKTTAKESSPSLIEAIFCFEKGDALWLVFMLIISVKSCGLI